ncbi:MAG: SLC13 family permease [Bacteroidales bacterium]
MSLFSFFKSKNSIFKIKDLMKNAGTMLLLLLPVFTFASGGGASSADMPSVGGIRIEFFLFAATLLCVAIFHDHTFYVALTGLVVILSYKLIMDSGFNFLEHFIGNQETNPFLEQITNKETRAGEWGIMLNLLGLLLGFAVLAKLFEESGVPDRLPNILPNNFMGPFMLLVMIFILSSFLDNIAAALIGGTIALVVFNKKVHIGYLAAIVAASNAGGAGSVIGDTTTTMMWIDGVNFVEVLHAFIASGTALIIIAWFAAHQQHKFQPIMKSSTEGTKIKYGNLFTVLMILAGAITTNVMFDMPWLGVWVALVIGMIFSKVPWGEVSGSIKGSIFLLSLVLCASMMPVDTLPEAHWSTAFILGFVSAVFDNIPLTKLCLDQGHYDWGMLAYAVGFGGSMIWFGSSAGVAITNKFPEGRNVMLWLRKGWHVTLAYIVGFFVLLIVWGWHPTSNSEHKEPAIECDSPNCKVAIEAKILNGKELTAEQQKYLDEHTEVIE